MSDLSAISDDDLIASLPRGVRTNNPLNLKDTSGQFRSFATPDEGVAAADQNLLAYNTKHGINTVAGAVTRWAPPTADGNNTGAYIAHVAGRMGVDPRSPMNLKDPAVRQQMLSAMAEFENGAPVLGEPKSALSDVSDADLLASLPKPQAGKSALGLPAPIQAGPAPVAAPQRAAAGQSGPTIAQDALSGLLQPFQTLGHGVMEDYRAKIARAKGPAPSLLEFAKQAIGDVGSTGRMLGDVLGLASAPVQAVVKPTARALTNYGPTPYSAPSYALKDGRVLMTDPVALKGDAAQAANEALINTALSGARPAGIKGVPLPKPMDVAGLKAAKTAAYDAAGASGYRFPSADVQAVADDVGAKIRDMGGPKAAELLKPSDAMHARLDALAKAPEGVSPTQLDSLRSDVYDLLVKPGGADAKIGGEIRKQIDDLFSASGNSDILAARDLNTRYMKAKEVTDRVDSAELAQETAGTGGNQNAIRQKLKPLIDPKSPQRIRNLTPDEVKAVRNVTKGTAMQNALRLLTAFDPTAGKLQAMLSAGMGAASHGASLAMMPVGMAAKAGEQAISAKSVQALLDLISQGGVRPGSGPQPSPILQLAGRPAPAFLSPAGLTGAAEVAAPLARIPAAREKKKASARAR